VVVLLFCIHVKKKKRKEKKKKDWEEKARKGSVTTVFGKAIKSVSV